MKTSFLRTARRVGPASAALALSLFVLGCRPGPTKVAQGQQYFSEDSTYDQFFAQLYQLQFSLGQAPNADQASRARVAAAVGAADTASTKEIQDALEKRVEAFGKNGVTLDFDVAGLDGDSPSVKVKSTGATKPHDKALVAALEKSAADSAALVGELHRAKPVLESLRVKAAALEPGIEQTFRKGGPGKKGEVERNLKDAESLIPLMIVRADEVWASAHDFLKAISKHESVPAAPPPVAPVAEPAAEVAPKKGKPGKGPPPKKIVLEETEEEPAEKPAAKPAAPPPDDFEP